MKKRIIAIVLTLVMVLGLSAAYALPTNVRTKDLKCTVDGVAVDLPDGYMWISEDGYTMVGARALVEAAGGKIAWDSATRTAVITGLTNSRGQNTQYGAYEHLVQVAAYQMSAEAHALMMQAFNVAKENVDEMVAEAKAGTNGFAMKDGKLFKDGKRVAIVSDIDDTLVDGVHYTANIVMKNGDWNNAAFARFIMSDGCNALPGAVEFVKYAVKNGVEFFYVTNRTDQGYKKGQKDSQGAYSEKNGYMPKGKLVGDSIYDVYKKTMYEISVASMKNLGFPINDDAHLIMNDTKEHQTSKEAIRQTIAAGGVQYTGESAQSTKFASEFTVNEHYIAMLMGDDLNDISDLFATDAVARVFTAIENNDKWGNEWIVLPNGVYGSCYNQALGYGYAKLFDYFDYTNTASEAWTKLYK